VRTFIGLVAKNFRQIDWDPFQISEASEKSNKRDALRETPPSAPGLSV
jgi:hypothetical protein